MARIRTIKPTFFTSSTIASLPVEARLTFIGLWTYVDDHGRGPDDPRLVKAAVWPLDDRITAKAVDGHLALLEQARLVVRYAVAGRPYLHIRTWTEHQRVSHPQKSSFPEPLANRSVELPEDSGAIHEPLGNPPEPLGNVPEPLRPEVEVEGNGENQPSSPSEFTTDDPQPVDDDDEATQRDAVDKLIGGACHLLAVADLNRLRAARPDLDNPPPGSERELAWLNETTDRLVTRRADDARKLLAKDPHLDSQQLAAALTPPPPAPKGNATNHEDLTGAAAKRIRDENEARRATAERLAAVEAERKTRAEELLAKMSTDDRKKLLAEVEQNLGPGARRPVIESAMRTAVLERQAS